MNSAAVRPMMFLACILVGLAFGLAHELEDPPNSVDWALAGLSVLAMTIAIGFSHQSFGVSPLLGAPLLAAMWAAAVLGDFLPYTLGLGERAVGDYGHDNWWQLMLIVYIVSFALMGFLAGLLSAATAWLLLRFTRLTGRATEAR